MGAFELIAVGQLAAFACASGLLIALLLQPIRGRSDGVLVIFCAMLAAWSSVALVHSITGLRLVVAVDTRNALLLTTMSGAGFAYFLFIARAIKTENRFATLLTLALPLVLGGVLLSIWSGSMLTRDQAQWQPLGYAVLVGQLIYAVAIFWSIMISREEIAPQLRLAGSVMIAAFSAPLIAPSMLESVALVLVAISALRIGWVVIRRQSMQPLKALGDELRIANRDLRQSVEETTSERRKNRELTQEIQAMNDLRRDFLETLGHRLRTPLNSITGYNQLLQSGVFGELNDLQLDRLSTIARNSQRLLELINDMLDLNTLDAGRVELHLQPVALKNVIERVVLDLESQRAAKQLQQEIAVAEELAPVLADEGRLCQVLAQLVSNAIKFTPEGKIHIRALNVRVHGGVSLDFALPVRGWLGDGDWVITSVEDTGIGIAPEDQGKLFDAFYQANNGQSQDNIGSGLGLAISKRLIEQHEGVMWLRSTVGQGTVFLFALRAYRPITVAGAQMQVVDKEMMV